MTRRRLQHVFRVGVLLVLGLLVTSLAHADDPVEAADADALPWRWRRHHIADYVATGTFGAVALITEVVPERDEPRLSGGVGLDDAFRDAFMLGNFDDRQVAARFSDITLTALAVYPLIDSALVAWAGHGSGDAAWQMAAIDLQAMAFTVAITNGTKRAFERERPSSKACREDPRYDARCHDLGRDGSFYSGHTSLAFTAASLTCTHHAHLALYGGAGDVIACVAAGLAATSVGFERILADRHYLSDVLVGSAVGVFSGAVLPWLSFYAWQKDKPQLTAWSVAPQPSPYGASLSLRGWF